METKVKGVHTVRVHKVSVKGKRTQIAQMPFEAKNFIKKATKEKAYNPILMRYLAKHKRLEIDFESEDLTQFVTYQFEIIAENKETYIIIGNMEVVSCDLGFECYKTGFEV